MYQVIESQFSPRSSILPHAFPPSSWRKCYFDDTGEFFHSPVGGASSSIYGTNQMQHLLAVLNETILPLFELSSNGRNVLSLVVSGTSRSYGRLGEGRGTISFANTTFTNHRIGCKIQQHRITNSCSTTQLLAHYWQNLKFQRLTHN